MQCITCNLKQVMDFPFMADSGESISKTKMDSLLPCPEYRFSSFWTEMDSPFWRSEWIFHFLCSGMEFPFTKYLWKFHFLKNGFSIFSGIMDFPFLQEMENPLEWYLWKFHFLQNGLSIFGQTPKKPPKKGIWKILI